MIRAVQHIAAMNAYALADLGDHNTISLAQNESAFPPSPNAISAARLGANQLHLYPDPEWSDLRAAIADVHDLEAQKILCGAGSMELIGCLIRTFAGPGDRILGTDYGYAYVSSAAAQVAADYVKARETDFTISVDDVLQAVTPKTKIVFICNPGNPTGTLLSNSEIIRLRDNLHEDILLVVDQAYAEFADDRPENAPNEIFNLVHRGNTIVTRTFSKAYGLAGARVGWGYFPPKIAVEIRKLLNPNNISISSQLGACAAMQDRQYLNKIVSDTSEIRDRFAKNLKALSLAVPDSYTNFVLIQFSSAKTMQKADAALRAENLLMRGMGGYGLPDCLRATICENTVMQRALDVLERINDDT